MALVFLSSENENPQLEDLLQADFGRLPERHLLSVNSINENFVFVIMIQRIFRLKSQRKRTIFIYCCFCNHDSTHVSILRVSANALYDYYSRIADLFIFIH